MILLVHMLFGAAVGYKIYLLTQSVWLAGFLALASHYFLDLFPHVEYLTSAEESVKKIKTVGFVGFLGDASKVALDFCIGLVLLFLFSKNPATYLYALLAIVPDGVTVINTLFPNAILQKHQRIHGDIIQYFTKTKKPAIFWRIFTQFIAFCISVSILIY